MAVNSGAAWAASNPRKPSQHMTEQKTLDEPIHRVVIRRARSHFSQSKQTIALHRFRAAALLNWRDASGGCNSRYPGLSWKAWSEGVVRLGGVASVLEGGRNDDVRE